MDEFEKKLKYIKEAILQRNDIEKVIDHGLLGGTSGIALFFFYYSQYANDEKLYDKACELIEDCFEKVKNGAVYQTFAGGLAGIGWLIEHLSQMIF
jgi:lantibiotic modifying enzyme